MWLLCDEPTSSTAARVFAVISVVCILVSVTNFCVETLPMFERQICINVTVDGGKTYFLRPNYAVHNVIWYLNTTISRPITL